MNLKAYQTAKDTCWLLRNWQVMVIGSTPALIET